MSTWNGTYEGVPDGGDSPSTLGSTARDLKTSIEGRMENEHDTYVADGTTGAEAKDWRHKEGSARAYYQSAEPTNQPGSNGAALGADDEGRIWVDSDTNEIKAWNGSVFKILYPSPQILHVRDEKSNGTNGGASTSLTWHTRVLNTEVTNTITGASLSSNQITLPAGTYKVTASAPSRASLQHKVALYNTTDSSYDLIGSNESADNTSLESNRSFITATLTIIATKVFELRHYIRSGLVISGLGSETFDAGTVEVYAEVFIEKIS